MQGIVRDMVPRQKCRSRSGSPDTCAVWPALENVDAMERDFGVPVFTNFAMKYWAAMSTLKIPQTIKAYGRLLETLGE